MGGRGPTPKDPSRRARRNQDVVPLRVLPASATPQPALPQVWFPDPLTGKSRRFTWPARTKSWWKIWGDSPLSRDFTDADWAFLLDTALLHAQYWSGNLSLAGELRLRQAKMGATPEDRARLRIVFAQAEDAERAGHPSMPASRQRRGGLRPLAREGSSEPDPSTGRTDPR